ncbi:MAG TPA: hypothetical protein VFU07_00890 [Candidatus Lumbricidophila sp.]|nr:hypothetical protein [Candidatus Lumbricidophila sp.]
MATASVAPTAHPASASKITVTWTALNVTYPDRVATVVLSDSAALISLFTEISGSAPAVTDGTNKTPGSKTYEWDGVRVFVWAGWPTRVWFTKPSLGGANVSAPGNVSVGATKQAVVAANADAKLVSSGEGTDLWAVDAHEVPGTKSIQDPNQTGQAFVTFVVKSDVVTEILAPGDDYTEL